MEVYTKEICQACAGMGMRLAKAYFCNMNGEDIRSAKCSACNGLGYILIPEEIPDNAVIGHRLYTTLESEDE